MAFQTLAAQVDGNGFDPFSEGRSFTERKIQAEDIVSRTVRYGERRITVRDRLDDVLLHPFWGYICLMIILLVFFEVIYGLALVRNHCRPGLALR
jgi:Fe2+ transport system protein B